jgi:hypothetical protein
MDPVSGLLEELRGNDTDLPRVAVAIERRLHLHQPNPATDQEATIAVTV